MQRVVTINYGYGFLILSGEMSHDCPSLVPRLSGTQKLLKALGLRRFSKQFFTKCKKLCATSLKSVSKTFIFF